MKNKHICAIIFDCDGTLVDSEPSHFLSWQQVLKKRGLEHTLDEHHTYTGKSDLLCAEIFAAQIGSISAEELFAEKSDYYHQLQAKGLPAIQSTVDVVRLLAKEKQRHHLKLGVASAAFKKEILANLRSVGIEQHFDIILSGHEDLVGYSDPEGVNKPKPYIYQHAAKLLCLSPEQCVAIEDSHTGVTAAIKAGCVTIAIPNRFTQYHDLSHATFRLDSFAGLGVDHFLQLVSHVKPQ